MRYLTFLMMLLALFQVRAADRDLAGRFTGEWKSNGSGGGGAFRMKLDVTPESAWKWEVTFIYAGAEIKTTPRDVKVKDSKLEGSYDFDLQGFALRSQVTGEWKGKAFEGRNVTTTTDGSTGVDEGTWKLTRAE